MTVSIKVLPTADEHVGLVHPVDGPLAAEGGLWTYNAWTEARLQEQVIRRFEADVDGAAVAETAEPKTAGKARAQAAA